MLNAPPILLDFIGLITLCYGTPRYAVLSNILPLAPSLSSTQTVPQVVLKLPDTDCSKSHSRTKNISRLVYMFVNIKHHIFTLGYVRIKTFGLIGRRKRTD
jgi:hypothetical protein